MEEVVVRRRQRQKGFVRVIYIGIALIVLLTSIGFIGGTLFLKRSLPKINGTVSVKGLEHTVLVTRDNEGVPHIQADSLHDLYMAQGYVQAQDRLFQMDLSRRQASGQLSEVIGEATIERDKFFRTFGLRRAAEVSYENYSKEAKQMLEWFAQGVNTYMQEAIKNNKLPVEFTILGYKPTEWTPIDSLTIGKYMAFDLGGHWEGQAFRYHLLQTLPREKALDLFPSYPQGGPAIIESIVKSDINIEQSFASAVIPPEFNGSNNWVVSGSKTKSGKPILADDPHLSLATPAIWYQMHLNGPGVNVSGVIFAGIPGIILGHTDHIAWGVTNVGPDVQDLYIEKRNPNDSTSFLYKDSWEKAKVIPQKIKVKGKDDIDYKVVITRHGPVISEFAQDKQQDTVLALKWTALEPSTELEAVMRMNKAKDWESFKEALTFFHTPAQNFVFASKDGTIAYRANGKIPIREKGDSLVPVPGWTGEYEWTGYIPWDDLPTIVNPVEGFIATANNKVVNDDYPYHISNEWAQPYRAMRINEVLKQKNNITVQDMEKLQMDQYDLQAKEFVPIFLSYIDENKLSDIEKQGLTLLKEWKYKDDRDLGAPLVFQLWKDEISKVLFDKDISQDMDKLFEGKGQIVDQLIRHAHENNPGPWIKENGGLENVLNKSYKNTIKRIQEMQGSNVQEWKWGSYHRITFSHPLSSVSVLKYLFNSETPIPVGGSRVTVQAAGWNPKTGLVNHGASWRFVIDLEDITKGNHIVAPGQSGHVASDWYHNQFKDWVKGTYHTTYLYNEEGQTLQLLPLQ
ncbi:penicillin acylase family protein [Bacillus sp. 165]|uniref:penicillin acylase family protein n=1 Tax=Bacillus sp. 165 TaxID=1529117 RepID=UPI001ADCC0A8|nr:penicillin acylase family protein [Bacillus sp. 165]MBO9128844.1 penicillin acylase family protein [Bacillus sp. 165]